KALLGADPPLAPLFPKNNTLLAELAKEEQAADQRAEDVGEALRWLDALRVDGRVSKEKREQAGKFLAGLSRDLVSEQEEVLDLLDGGVNDNTGLPTLL